MRSVITIVFIFFIHCIHAQVNEFLGTQGGNWAIAANWSLGLPVSGQEVLVDGQSVYIPAGEDVEIASFTINNGGKILIGVEASLLCSALSKVVSGELSNQGFFMNHKLHIGANGILLNTGYIDMDNVEDDYDGDNFFSKIANDGHIQNNGTIHSHIDFHITIIRNNGSFNNTGFMNQRGIGDLFYNTGTFINETTGAINIQSLQNTLNIGFQITNYNYIENKGSISIDVDPDDTDGRAYNAYRNRNAASVFDNRAGASFTISNYTNTPVSLHNNSTFNNQSILSIKNTNQDDLLITGGSAFNNTAGILEGNGSAYIRYAKGILRPGNSAGELRLSGSNDFDLEADTHYECEIAGTAGAGLINGNDLLSSNRSIHLNGASCTVSFIDGYTPQLGDNFLILEAFVSNRVITGTFATLDLPSLPPNLVWEVNYSDTELNISIVANPLPIDLIYFDVEVIEQTHRIEWRTASEYNSLAFDLEYSTDAIRWETINTTASTNSSVLQDYQYTNTQISPAKQHYYRLKMVDIDGSFSYSDIRSVKAQIEPEINISPNPFRDQVQLSQPIKNYSIYNDQAQLVYQNKMNNNKINLSFLTKGLYLIKMTDMQGHIHYKRLVKL